jgi:hypothetical protein
MLANGRMAGMADIVLAVAICQTIKELAEC